MKSHMGRIEEAKQEVQIIILLLAMNMSKSIRRSLGSADTVYEKYKT